MQDISTIVWGGRGGGGGIFSGCVDSSKDLFPYSNQTEDLW